MQWLIRKMYSVKCLYQPMVKYHPKFNKSPKIWSARFINFVWLNAIAVQLWTTDEYVDSSLHLKTNSYNDVFFCYSANQIFQYQPCRVRSMYRPVSQNHQKHNKSHIIYDPHNAIMLFVKFHCRTIVNHGWIRGFIPTFKYNPYNDVFLLFNQPND